MVGATRSVGPGTHPVQLPGRMPRGAGAGLRLQVYLEVLLGKALAVRASGQLGYQCASGVGKCLTYTAIAIGHVSNGLVYLRTRTLLAALHHLQCADVVGSVLRGLRERGLSAPLLAIGDGALGLWSALDEGLSGRLDTSAAGTTVCLNVAARLPKSMHSSASRRLREISHAPTPG